MTIDTLIHQGSERTHVGLAGIDTARLKAMRNEHLRGCFNRIDDTPCRREFVARVLGREYINDAAARNVNATWYSLESAQGGLIWIASGSNGDTDYSKLVSAALRKVRMLIVVGGDDAPLRAAFSGVVPQIEHVATMAEALQHAYNYDSSDVKVLFSPACDNGVPTAVLSEQFRREVNEL